MSGFGKMVEEATNDILSAKEARALLTTEVNKAATDELKSADKQIRKAISENKNNVTISKVLSKITQDNLKQLGYTVSSGSGYDQRDGDSWAYTTITW